MRHSVQRFSMAAGMAVLVSLSACTDSTNPLPTAAGTDGAVATPAFAATVAGKTSYVLIAPNTSLPANLAASVAAAGGTLTVSQDAIGVAMAESDDPSFAAKAKKIKGLQTVVADQIVQWVHDDDLAVAAFDGNAPPATGSSIGDDESFWFYQWAPRSVHAPEAWDLGARGTGVRVAVIDGGIRATHIDLAPVMDVAHSTSFVPGFPFNTDVGTGFWHAMHVAGIVAAADNGLGTIGIAPGATIIGVKALHGGSGSFGAVIQAIVYAATPIAEGGGGANIINMSLGAVFPKQGSDAAHLANAIGRATTYAYQRGVTVIASMGNDYLDLDHSANLISVPAMSPHVISVSATAPEGFAYGATDFTRPASYTNFGQSAVIFAGPGGDFDLPDPLYVYDMVLSPASGGADNGYYFAAGTSMSSPAVAGVAALIIEKNGGSMSPAQVEAALRQSADDLGKPGNDDYYGRGFVNALRAVQ